MSPTDLSSSRPRRPPRSTPLSLHDALPVGEWPHRVPCQSDNAYWRSFPQHWNTKQGTKAGNRLRHVSVFRIGKYIGNMNNLAFGQHSSRNRAPVNFSRVVCDEFRELRRKSIARFNVVSCALRSTDNSLVRFTETSGRLDQRVKHGLQIESRATYDLKHVEIGRASCRE